MKDDPQMFAAMSVVGYIYDDYNRMKKPPEKKQKIDILRQERLLTPYDITDSSITGFPCSVSSDKTKIFFEYPEYDLLQRIVNEEGRADVVIESGTKIRRVTLSKKYAGELKVEDRDFDDQPMVGAIANLVERLRGCERYAVEMNECLQRGTLDDVAKQPIADKAADMFIASTNALETLRSMLLASKIENDSLNDINDVVVKLEADRLTIDESYALALNNKSAQERQQAEQANKTGKGFSVGGAIGLGAWLGFQHLIKAAATKPQVLLILLL